MSVRPIGDLLDIRDSVLKPFDQDKEENENRQGDNSGEGGEDDGETMSLEEEEGIKVKLGKMEKAPTKEEVMAHRVNHIPFRSWCEHCVKGKANGNPHSRKNEIDGESR